MISVVLCTYNPNDNYLTRALDAILAQDLSFDEWELLVVDNNSTIPVKDRDYVKSRNVRVVSEKKQGLSAARECGLKHSVGNVLVFVDDDNVLATDYLSNVKRIFETQDIGIVSGSILPEYEKEPAGWFGEWEAMLAIRRVDGERTYLTNIPSFNEFFPIGAGMSVRREIMEEYYNAIAGGSAYISGRTGSLLSSAEDIDLDFFAVSRGFLIGTIGTLRMKHIIPATRTTTEYICRLAKGSTISADEVNTKWKPIFRCHVFPFFRFSKFKLSLSFFASALMYWNPKYRIRYHFFKTLLFLHNRVDN